MRDRLVVPGVLLGVVLAVIALRWLPDPALSLEYLKVLVWPSVVLALLYVVRDSLPAKLSAITEAAGFGGSFKFHVAEVNALASRGLRDASPAPEGSPDTLDGAVVRADSTSDELTSAKTETPPATPVAPARDGTGRALADMNKVHADFEARERKRRRAAMGKSFTEGADWAWNMSQVGSKSRPVPVIEWSDDGQPLVRLRDESLSDRIDRIQSRLLEATVRAGRAQDAVDIARRVGADSDREVEVIRSAHQEQAVAEMEAAEARAEYQRVLSQNG